MNFQPVTLAELRAAHKPVNKWGSWRFDSTWLCITHEPSHYEIDLEEINSCAEILDWIIQISNKIDAYEVDQLVHAIRDVLNPQRNCCSFGTEKEFSGSKLAKAYAARLEAADVKPWCVNSIS